MPEKVEPTYDVITCLSVSKWVHLNHGDQGILALFRRCHDLLRVALPAPCPFFFFFFLLVFFACSVLCCAVLCCIVFCRVVVCRAVPCLLVVSCLFV